MRLLSMNFAALAVIFGMAADTQAGVVTVVEEIDLTTVPNLESFTHGLPSSVVLPTAVFGTPDESVSITVDFKNNQALTISGALFVGLDKGFGSVSGSLSNVSLAFTDFSTTGSGAATVSSGSKNIPSTSSFGPTFNIGELGISGSGETVTFSGFTLTYDLFIMQNAMSSNTLRLATTGDAELTMLTGSSGGGATPSPVPLPASITMLCLGFGILAGRKIRPGV